jgi:lysozyme
VKEGDVCTQDEADQWLTDDLLATAAVVERMLRVFVFPEEFDALCDFAYNVGTGALLHSTLLARLNAGDTEGAANQFREWTKAHVNGQTVELPGLVKRRAAEEALFRSGIVANIPMG